MKVSKDSSRIVVVVMMSRNPRSSSSSSSSRIYQAALVEKRAAHTIMWRKIGNTRVENNIVFRIQDMLMKMTYNPALAWSGRLMKLNFSLRIGRR